MFMHQHVITHVYKCMFHTCIRFVCANQPVCTFCLSTVWPSRTLPAVLTLVCVDSKHSCRSQRPRSGRTRGSEGQWWRGERAYREHKGRKWMVELEKYAFGWIQSAQEKEGERLVYLGKEDRRDFNLGLEKEKKMR